METGIIEKIKEYLIQGPGSDRDEGTDEGLCGILGVTECLVYPKVKLGNYAMKQKLKMLPVLLYNLKYNHRWGQ